MADMRSDDRARSGEPLPPKVPITGPTDEPNRESPAPFGDPRFLAIIEEARAQCRQGLGLPMEEVRRELGLR
jgi:hypothetical protein